MYSISENYNEIKDIRNFLYKFNKYKIIYIPNPGNAGDSLITFGTIKILNELKLDWEYGNWQNKYANELILYGGGGNLVGMYIEGKTFLNQNKDNNKIIVLPHTIKDEDEIIKGLNNNVILICREKKSYNYVKSIFKYENNLFLSKDMALYIKNVGTIKFGYGICNAFRTDPEKTDIQLPDDNLDISYHVCMENNCDKNVIPVTYNLLKYLSQFRIINTNRLHICIAGHILGKQINLFPNNYWKNKEVYEYSLKNFRNIKFIDHVYY